jgi:hypothetical protein
MSVNINIRYEIQHTNKNDSIYFNCHGEVHSIQNNVIKFVSDLEQVWFPLRIKLTVMKCIGPVQCGRHHLIET